MQNFSYDNPGLYANKTLTDSIENYLSHRGGWVHFDEICEAAKNLNFSKGKPGSPRAVKRCLTRFSDEGKSDSRFVSNENKSYWRYFLTKTEEGEETPNDPEFSWGGGKSSGNNSAYASWVGQTPDLDNDPLGEKALRFYLKARALDTKLQDEGEAGLDPAVMDKSRAAFVAVLAPITGYSADAMSSRLESTEGPTEEEDE